MGRPDCYGIKLIACALGITERTFHRYVAAGMPVHYGEQRTDGVAVCLADAEAWRRERSIALAAGRIFRALPWAVVRYREARRGRVSVAPEQIAMWAA